MHRGVKELDEFRKTRKHLSRADAMAAFCADCMGNYLDGRMDCKNKRCPLYEYMPFRKLTVDTGTKTKTDVV